MTKSEFNEKEEEPCAESSDAIRLYLKNIVGVPMLSAEEETALFKTIEAGGKEGDAALARVVEANLRLVVSVVKRYMNRGMEFLDLVPEGNMGLMRAVAGFDYHKGCRFSTYATWWMLNKVMKPQTKMGAMVSHTSLSEPYSKDFHDNETTVEDVLGTAGLAVDYNSPSCIEIHVNPAAAIDKKRTDENFDLCSALKKLKTSSSLEGFDKNKVMEMSKYLLSIVEKNKNNQNAEQIFLYLFKKIFNKCSLILQGTEIASKLTPYVESAAKSKVELLGRLNMNEKQYESECKRLMNGGYEGI